MLMEVHDGKVVDAEVEELEGAVAARDDELVLVDLGPGKVVEGVVCVEAVGGARARIVSAPLLDP